MRKLLLLFLLIAMLAGAYASYSFYSYMKPISTTPQTVIIPSHTGAQAVIAQLHEQGLVPPLEAIAIPLFLSGNVPALKAGEYEFEAGMSPASIIAKIAKGEVVIHKVTIPEGWNVREVRAALMNEPLLTGELPEQIAEGSVMPDTIHFSRGETRANVLAKLQKAQSELLEKLWPSRIDNLPITTPQEALILASIVEKETGVVDERPMVAGVFTNRLRQGMMLQSDPTVVYGVEKAHGGAPMGRPLSKADLATDTPYNTYTRTGLTPTPICNPGKAAIEAVLSPAATDALYFVATGNGGHNFAATLKEHEANVAAYRKAMSSASDPKKSN